MRVRCTWDVLAIAAVMLVSFDRSAIVAADVSAKSGPHNRPNVLLIYTDDHAQWAVGAYGNEEVRTPNIDRLADNGMRFTRGFTKPVCSPSRAMLLSGQYSHRLGIPDYIPYGNPVMADNGLPAGTPTIASVLADVGYKTALFGKWHIGYGERYYPTLFGFDKAEGYRYVAPGKAGLKLGQIPYVIAGVEQKRFGRSTDVALDCTTILADRAIDFIRTNRESPFFVYLAFYRPHLPWLPVPEQDYRHYQGRPVTVADPPSGCSVTKAQLAEWMRLYYGNVTCADRNVGRVVDTLDQLGLKQKTMVIFIGDNGFMVGQHALLGKGNARVLHANARGRISRDKGTRANMFNESVHVPFIVSWPDVVPPGRVNDALVSTIDILPTVAETAGVQTPSCVDGQSLLPLLSGDPKAVRRKAYCDTYDMIYLGDNGEQPHMRMIYTDDWKLVLYEDEQGKPLDGGSRHELFDLKNDPGEMKNLYGKASVAAIQRGLATQLRDWMRQTGVTK